MSANAGAAARAERRSRDEQHRDIACGARVARQFEPAYYCCSGVMRTRPHGYSAPSLKATRTIATTNKHLAELRVDLNYDIQLDDTKLYLYQNLSLHLPAIENTFGDGIKVLKCISALRPGNKT